MRKLYCSRREISNGFSMGFLSAKSDFVKRLILLFRGVRTRAVVKNLKEILVALAQLNLMILECVIKGTRVATRMFLIKRR